MPPSSAQRQAPRRRQRVSCQLVLLTARCLANSRWSTRATRAGDQGTATGGCPVRHTRREWRRIGMDETRPAVSVGE
jgi:hypothetical protein